MAIARLRLPAVPMWPPLELLVRQIWLSLAASVASHLVYLRSANALVATTLRSSLRNRLLRQQRDRRRGTLLIGQGILFVQRSTPAIARGKASIALRTPRSVTSATYAWARIQRLDRQRVQALTSLRAMPATTIGLAVHGRLRSELAKISLYRRDTLVVPPAGSRQLCSVMSLIRRPKSLGSKVL